MKNQQLMFRPSGSGRSWSRAGRLLHCWCCLVPIPGTGERRLLAADLRRYRYSPLLNEGKGRERQKGESAAAKRTWRAVSVEDGVRNDIMTSVDGTFSKCAGLMRSIAMT